INPFDLDNPLNLKITSNDLEFINTPEYHLIGKLNLELSLLNQNILHISGDINIPKGLINLEKQHSRIVKSKDIILINPQSNFENNNISKTSSNDFKIFPEIDLRIEENTRLIGIGLNANITGKLKIYTLNTDYNNWLGDGRITIKQGIYILSNQKFLIDKGRMIYLPGTLINNPILDIKILANQDNFSHKSNEKYLYIEGTLEKPVIRDVGLIDEKQAILQILNLGNTPISSGIKEKFNLTEFGIQDNNYETNKEFKELNEQQSFLDNKNFVIGKKLSKKVDFKYFRTLNTSNNTVKLKYNFHRNFAFEIESSTIDGYGSDFTFYKEIQ
ncbi:MAG: translocation/assembly module TamB domain-containing protein, partial [Gammaproteobacteria bacterium]